MLFRSLTGLFLAALGLDVHVHDTYFVVAHFHYIMVGGAIMGFFAGLHYYWPKITGRMYSDYLAKLAALLVFVGFNLTFFPQFILGYLLPMIYFIYSLFKGEKAGANPWLATGLEWQTQSPPLPHNFTVQPVVTEGAYEYSKREIKVVA